MSTCVTHNSSSNWLTSGCLNTCLLKLISPKQAEWESDSTRPTNIKILKNLLSVESGGAQSLLQHSFSNEPGLILAPELAFGSADYSELHTIISSHGSKILFISGFGFTQGSALNQLKADGSIIPVWDGDLNTDAKYNCGWLWINDGEGNTSCYVFLKNFIEQTSEITIPNLAQGNKILRFQANDLIIFPLICADIISEQTDSPTSAVLQSLTDAPAGNHKVLITGSLYDTKSSSDRWKTPLGTVLSAHHEARILLSNCNDPSPIENETDDQWRCLSGAYQFRSTATKEPAKPLPHVRFIVDTQFAGFVLRVTQAGCAFGDIKWSHNDPATGKYVWAPRFRYLLHEEKLVLHDGLYAADELCRFIRRFKCSTYNNAYSAAVKTFADEMIDKILTELEPASSSPLRKKAEELFNKCLSGILYKEEKFSPESLHDEKAVLNCALTVLLFIKDSLDGRIFPDGETVSYGQLLSADNDREILVWASSKLTGKKMYEHLEELAQESGSARPLIVVARGDGNVVEPPSGRIQSRRTTDITGAAPEQDNRDIQETRDRVISWRQLGEIGEVFAPEKAMDALKIEIKGKLEP